MLSIPRVDRKRRRRTTGVRRRGTSWPCGALVPWTTAFALLLSASAASGQRILPIEERIAQAYVLSDLEAYLVMSGVASEIRATNGRAFTMFALTDYAWSGVPYATKLQTLSWRAHTASFLRGFIHEEEVVDGQSTGGPYTDERTLSMLNGAEVEVGYDGVRTSFNGVRHVAQAECTNGYIYMLSWSRSDWPDPSAPYFVPPWERTSLAQAVASLPSDPDPARSYAIIKDMVSQYVANDGAFAADLQEAEPTTGVALMFLAPTDAAFADAGVQFKQGFCGSMYTPQAMGQLESMVQAHIIQTVLPSDWPFNEQDVVAASGNTWTWQQTEEAEVPVVTNGLTRAELMPGQLDRLSIAGIVHGVDTLLWVEAD